MTPPTLAEALTQAVQQTPDRVLLVDSHTRLTCSDLHEQARTLATAMLARMPAGSVVSFMLPNWHEAAVVYLAATLAGMVVNPILPSLRDAELQFILTDSGCRMIFAPTRFRGHDYPAMLARVVAGLADPPEVVPVRSDSDPFGGGGDAVLPTLDPDAARLLLYTSGTTGRAKGVLHSHNSINALIAQLGRHWLIEPEDRFLVPSPIAHIGGSIYAFEAPLLLDTTAVLMDTWDPDTAVRLMLDEHCTHMAGATPFLAQLLEAARRAGTDLPDLKLFVCGGASVPASLIDEAAGYFRGAAVTRVYGSSEVPVTTIGAVGAAERRYASQTDGRAGDADVKLVSRPGVPPGEGEIYVRGPQMLLGYIHAEDDCFDAEGYFATGDLGRWVDDDYLLVTGRLKDVIIRNGENISAREVEDILAGHPGIAEVAVVGLPDPRTGERACAVIVPAGDSAPDVAELRAMLAERGVARFKAPEQVAIWDELPKNDAGKVVKHRIRAALIEGS